MAGLKAANLGLKFLLELGAIAAFAYWGASRSPVILAVILAIAMPAVFVAAWGIWAAPRSPRRLPRQTRVPFELGCFTVAAVALIAAGASRGPSCCRPGLLAGLRGMDVLSPGAAAGYDRCAEGA
jgi:hypothetical protein